MPGERVMGAGNFLFQSENSAACGRVAVGLAWPPQKARGRLASNCELCWTNGLFRETVAPFEQPCVGLRRIRA
jgi:hypothetical protein